MFHNIFIENEKLGVRKDTIVLLMKTELSRFLEITPLQTCQQTIDIREMRFNMYVYWVYRVK